MNIDINKLRKDLGIKAEKPKAKIKKTKPPKGGPVDLNAIRDSVQKNK